MSSIFRNALPMLRITAASALCFSNKASRSLDYSTNCEATRLENDDEAKLIFLGSGSSTGCPKPLCALLDFSKKQDSYLGSLVADMETKCRVSLLAIKGDPRFNKNYRNNPSILVSYLNESENGIHRRYNVIIDVGKTFREGAIRWMPPNGIQSLDAIVLTHDHFDAIGGLDDVRGFQFPTKNYNSTMPEIGVPLYTSIPVYLGKECLAGVQERFNYLFPKTFYDSKESPTEIRAVAALDFRIINAFTTFEPTPGFKMTPIPVMHGEDLICFGYSFAVGKTNVLYLSDISRMPESTMDFILKKLPPTDILIVDSLLLNQKHNTHFNFEQAVALANDLQPRQATYIVGINCDAFPAHEEMNQKLKESSTTNTISLAHDGLVINM